MGVEGSVVRVSATSDGDPELEGMGPAEMNQLAETAETCSS